MGAGLSGVCAAYYLKKSCPWKSWAIVEARESLGGTWDLFRYPGVRSDSDMPTLGYAFRPWTGEKAIADGPSILAYVKDTARVFGIDERIQYKHRVISASWSSETALWTVVVETPSGMQETTCQFLMCCTGYYDYDSGYLPEISGLDEFKGDVIHPQHWPSAFDYDGKRVVVVGSGATAVTLVPEMTERAAHVTMLQRSPTWIVSMPSVDRLANWLQKRLGAKAAHAIVRWKNIGFMIYSFQMAQRFPNFVGKALRKLAAKELPKDFDVEKHLNPHYKPWDQRLCLIPDSDLFKAIGEGKASIVTDEIERIEPDGILLKSGERLKADAIVTATGLNVKVLGGMDVVVDGTPINLADVFSYKGVLYTGIPNFAVALGYTNASWTLKCELIAQYVTRLINHMTVEGYDYAVPARPSPEMGARSTFELTSGYLERVRDKLPKQTERGPWKLYQNYVLDLRLMRFGNVTAQMIFGRKDEA